MEFYKIKDFCEKVELNHNTVYKWMDRAEELGIHVVQRNEQDMKIFDNLDAQVIEFIKRKRDEGFNVEGAILSLSESGLELRKPSETSLKKGSSFDLEEFKVALFESMRNEVAIAVERELKIQQTQQVKLLETKDEEITILKERLKLFEKHLKTQSDTKNEILLIRNIERKLEIEAENKWDLLPVKDRTKVEGILIKKRIEDLKKRELFIKKYVDDNFAEVLVKEQQKVKGVIEM